MEDIGLQNGRRLPSAIAGKILELSESKRTVGFFGQGQYDFHCLLLCDSTTENSLGSQDARPSTDFSVNRVLPGSTDF